MNGNYRSFDRRRNDGTRTLIIGAIIAVSIAIAVFAFLIFAELFGWFEGGNDPAGDLITNKFSTTEIEVSSSDVHKGDLILINETYKYVFPEIEPSVVPILSDRVSHGTSSKGNPIYSFYTQSGTTGCAKLEAETSKLFNQWTDGFYAATGNIDLYIKDNDGYRPRTGETATSEHHTGKVIDLYGQVTSSLPVYNIDDPEYKDIYQWIYNNAYKYGFIHRYPALKQDITGVDNESYHFRQVGYAHAYYMFENDLCLEEYLEEIKAYGPDNRLVITDGTGSQWSVYYVAANPAGAPIAMVHCTNGCSELDVWVKIFGEFAALMGKPMERGALYEALYRHSETGDPDCGGVTAYNYLSGEHLTNVAHGNPMYFRTPNSHATLANFMRAQLYATMATLKIGLNILLENENVTIEKLQAHGGLFKVRGVAQQILANAVNAPVAVMETAGEGGAWGMALLAAYMENSEGDPLDVWLDRQVFAQMPTQTLYPQQEGVEGFEEYLRRYQQGLGAQRALDL